jgi:hypothetical protein
MLRRNELGDPRTASGSRTGMPGASPARQLNLPIPDHGFTKTEEYLFAAELHRIEGEVRRAAGHPSTEIERCLRSALNVSRRQGAKMFELLAATALARL